MYKIETISQGQWVDLPGAFDWETEEEAEEQIQVCVKSLFPETTTDDYRVVEQ